MRRHRPRISNFAAGIIAALVIVAVVYLVFGGPTPWSGSPFVLKAVFTTETELHIPSPVRIAGVDVGQVTSVKSLGNNTQDAVVTMQIDSNGLPIHRDATAQILTRIFLEGNFYVDLHPGSPNAPTLATGATLPAANTAGPVQLDRVLAALGSSARANLQTLVQGFGASLNQPPTAAQDAAENQDPSVRGLTGAQALNQSLKYSAGAFEASAIVNQALLGSQPHDLSNAVDRQRGGVPGAGFAPDPAGQPRHHVRRDDVGARVAPAGPEQLDRDAPAAAAHDQRRADVAERLVRADAGVRQDDPARGRAARSHDRGGAAVAFPGDGARFEQAELGGLVKDLTPAVQETASTIKSTTSLLSASDALARCVSHNLVPTGNEVIQDPPLPSTDPRLPGAVRVRRGHRRRRPGLRRQRPLPALLAGRRLDSGADRKPRHAGAAVRKRGAAAAGDAPGLARSGAAGQEHQAVRSEHGARPEQREHGDRTMKTRSRSPSPRLRGHPRTRRPRGGHRRLHPRAPARLHLRPELLQRPAPSSRTSAAVTPGQGQAVTIAGVQVGQVGGVELQNGRAVVTMNIYSSTRRSIRTPPCCCARVRRSRTCTWRSIPATSRPGPCPTAGCWPRRPPRRTSTSTRSSPRSTPTAATTCCCSCRAARKRSGIKPRLGPGSGLRRRADRDRDAEPGGGVRPARHVQALRAARP